MNYFELLNIEALFPLDKKILTKHYRELQRQYHPDQFIMASEQEKLAAEKHSAEINEAYKTLCDPVKSALHLVELHHQIEQNQKNSLSPDFLNKQFSYREYLDDIIESNDCAKLDAFEEKIKHKQTENEIHLYNMLNEKKWANIMTLIDELRYYNKLVEQIESVQDEQFNS